MKFRRPDEQDKKEPDPWIEAISLVCAHTKHEEIGGQFEEQTHDRQLYFVGNKEKDFSCTIQ